MRMKRRYAKAQRELAADVMRALHAEPVLNQVLPGRLKADEQSGGAVLARVKVLAHRVARLVRNEHRALTIALADHSHGIGLPVAAVETQRLGDASPGRQQEQYERAIALLSESLGGQRLKELIPRLIGQRFRKPLGQLRDVDRGPPGRREATPLEQRSARNCAARRAGELEWKRPAAVGSPSGQSSASQGVADSHARAHGRACVLDGMRV